jgi:hypothetical protein
MNKSLSMRGYGFCRGCGSSNLHDLLDLGLHPLPAEYATSATQILDSFPLLLRICSCCGLGQLGEYVFPERIFHNKYPYLSSASSSWVQHAKSFSVQTKNDLNLDQTTLVVELASNDGYLLSEYQKIGINVLGVEPAENAAKLAIDKGVPTITRFFGEDLARSIVAEHGYPKLVIANNVYAHVPDINDFTAGLAALADESTLISIENPSFVSLLGNNLFDTIYHEHYSYLSANSVSRIAIKHGLNLFNIEELTTHGGSYRYWLSKSRFPEKTVSSVLRSEVDRGLFDPDFWHDFNSNVSQSLHDFRKWIAEREDNGDVVVGYGAAHKGNTFLNAVGPSSRFIKYVVDASPVKQGKFLPGSQIPVIAPCQLGLADPSDVLILPWNIAPEIQDLIKNITPRARVWVAQPKLMQL